MGFSADMILEWARGKQADDVDDSIPIPDPEPELQDSQLNSFHDSSYDDEGQPQSDDAIPIPDSESEPQDSQLSSFHDSSSHNDEGQSQSQESESQFTLGISTGKVNLVNLVFDDTNVYDVTQKAQGWLWGTSGSENVAMSCPHLGLTPQLLVYGLTFDCT